MTFNTYVTNRRMLAVVIVVVSILQLTTILPKIVATISTSVYVNVKYAERHFKYVDVEYVSSFGDYFVTYQDRHGEMVSFTVTPEFFPVYVVIDPLDRPLQF